MKLLHCVVLFLILVLETAQTVLKPGWEGDKGPELGGIYWILSSELRLKKNKRVPCVVFLDVREDSKYRVAQIHGIKQIGGLPVMTFFKDYPYLQTGENQKSSLERYIILPYEIYEVHGDPEIMKIYQELTYMQKNALEIFQNQFSMVDGWEAGQHGPLIGSVYWIPPRLLGLKGTALAHVPCVVICWAGENKYRVVRMSKRKRPNQHHVMDFFGNDARRRLTGLNYLKNHYIYLSKKYEVEGEPKNFQKWKNADLLTMPKEGLDRLVVASGMVDGWGADQDGPLLGHVYWIRPQDFKLNAKAGVYIPCVVVRRVGNKYRVAGMSMLKRPNGYRVTEFSWVAGLKTHIPVAGLNHLSDYYIYPHTKYEVEGDPKIMQRWETGDLLEVQTQDLHRLVLASELVDGWDRRRQHEPKFGGIYLVMERYLYITAKAGVYTPCVVLGHQHENRFIVVRINFPLPRRPAQEGEEINQLKNYNPREHYLVEGRPEIMQKRETEENIMQMKEELAYQLRTMVISLYNDHTKV